MEKYDIIDDVRGGIGLMTALELVSDRASKKLLSPPLILTEEDASIILSALESGFAAL